MNPTVSSSTISQLSTTMLIPLWAKAVEYDRPDALIQDAAAVGMLQQIDYDFSVFAKSKLSQPGCCARAALIDEEAQRFIAQHTDCVVVQLGAGLDARFERLGRPPVTAWYDLDLPNVIDIRRQLLPESGNHYLAGSMFEEGWADTAAAHGKPVLLLAEGVLMYFDEAQVKALLVMIARQLPRAVLVFDMLPPVAVGRAKQHDALGKMAQSPEFKWSLPDARVMEAWLPGSKVRVVGRLSERCGHRYPWLFRQIYRTGWGKRLFDQKIIKIELP
ncbi:class I SAM-dependent methyltransferase [Eikenella sp. S3360]|uniref:Class I SAM-dependent methyltransferase n=1 Tax=Eikenella glucosivorans TaxID=2766967 RepID=A0ABS0NAP6_9NEIS|nr:class I SAM-dependent methyltransferase [Eikenella glucosivorans]MBH5329345.1 class I SAM-dependent methyltransferase [Eikenella glucosivorans]